MSREEEERGEGQHIEVNEKPGGMNIVFFSPTLIEVLMNRLTVDPRQLFTA